MPVHADLTRHVQEVFLPALRSPHRETAQVLYEQLQQLEALRTQSAAWFTEGQSVARDECQKKITAIASAVREAYKQVIQVGGEPEAQATPVFVATDAEPELGQT